MGERDGGETEWRAIGDELARFGKVARDEGLRLRLAQPSLGVCQAADGRLFLRHHARPGAATSCGRRTSPGSCAAAADPIAEVGSYAGRVKAVHIKDIAPPGECADEDGWADVGHGTLDWAPRSCPP